PHDLPPPPAVRRVAERAWTRTSEPPLASWPTRGSLAGAHRLVGQAVTAWQHLTRHAHDTQPAAIGRTLTTASRRYTPIHGGGLSISVRSEERRVGKECRSRWSPYQ